MVLRYFYSLYKYCCFRCPERIKTEDEQRDDDMRIILRSFNDKMARMRRSRIMLLRHL